MPSKKALTKVAKDSSSSAVRRGSKESEGDEAKTVTSGGEAVAEPTGTVRDVPHIGAPREPATPIPNVQAEANPASTAPEDVRDGAVAPPNT